MLLSIQRDKQRLDNLYSKIESVDEPEMKSQWAKYLCVLTSGYIENSVRNIITDYSENKSAPALASFITRKVNNVTNLKHNNIVSLLESFSLDWAQAYESNVTDEQKDAVTSVVANRHLIAHGKNVGITYASVKKYYDDIIPTVELIHQVVNNEV